MHIGNYNLPKYRHIMYRGLSSILNFVFGRLPKVSYFSRIKTIQSREERYSISHYWLVHFYWYQSMLSDVRGFYLKCKCTVYYLLSLCCLLVLVQHLVEGVVKLAGDRVDLQLLPDDLVLQLVDPKVELGDVHLSVLGAGIGLLQPDVQLLDLVLVLLLPPPGLLLRDLQLLLVLADG